MEGTEEWSSFYLAKRRKKNIYREMFFLMIVNVEHYILFSVTVQGLQMSSFHFISSLPNSPCTFISFLFFCPFLSRSPASQKCTKSLWSQYMIIYHMHHLQLQHYFPPLDQSFPTCFINPYQTRASEMCSSWMRFLLKGHISNKLKWDVLGGAFSSEF